MAGGKKGKKGRCPADGKRKHPSSPPSKDFGDSEEVSSEYDRSPVPASPVASSDDSDDSMGLSIAEREYARSIERTGLGGSDDSKEASLEEVEDSSDSEREAVARAMVTRATTTVMRAATATAVVATARAMTRAATTATPVA
jgi:hypothetical protein